VLDVGREQVQQMTEDEMRADMTGDFVKVRESRVKEWNGKKISVR
jgi:hypothetical protein